MYCGIMVLQMIIEVGNVNHESVLRSWECPELVLITEALEHMLLALINSACIVLKPFVQLDLGSTANMGEWRLC